MTRSMRIGLSEMSFQELRGFWRTFRKSRSGIIAVGVIAAFSIVAILAPIISPYSVGDTSAEAWLPPSLAHVMGTDPIGRDVASLVIWGAQTTLEIGIVAAIISTILGTLVGGIAGYYGGVTDNVLMRITDTVLVVPTFFLALIVAYIFGGSFVNLVLIIGLTSWPTSARIVRAQVLSVKRRDFVEAVRSIGASNRYILLRYVLPNSLSPIIVAGALSTAGAMLSESYLSFLGVGDPNRVTWGQLLYYAVSDINAWWMVTFPGLALAVVVIAFNMFGQALNEALNPRSHGL